MFDTSSTSIILGALSIILLMGLGAYLYYQLRSYLLRRKLKKRFDHARDGEKSAKELLKEAGYLIEASQKTSKLPMWVNGKQFLYQVRPDAFVSKDGRKYLVEVKTGTVANNPTHSATRRQLLEYFHGFSVDGVLLVDAEIGQIHNVHFQQQRESSPSIPLENPRIKFKLLVAFILGVATTMLTVYFHLKERL